jgi:hypothetical protein
LLHRYRPHPVGGASVSGGDGTSWFGEVYRLLVWFRFGLVFVQVFLSSEEKDNFRVQINSFRDCELEKHSS